MKYALLTVSYSGLFYAGKALSLEEQIVKARDLGFSGLSIETKRPVASPLDLSKSQRAKIKAVAANEGIELCAVESMSNFTSRLMEERENNLAMMHAVLELAKDLGVNVVKVFAAWPGIINDEEDVARYNAYDRGNYFKPLYSDDLRRWNRAVEGIREVADIANDMGITLALQNHAPVLTPGYEDVLSMMQDIAKKNVKLCLDVPLFYDRQRDKFVKDAVQACGKNIILTHFGAWNLAEDEDGEVVQEPAPSFGGHINYETFIAGLQETGYDGYLVGEYCLPVIRNHRVAGIEEVDKAIKLSLRYIKNLVAKTSLVEA